MKTVGLIICSLGLICLLLPLGIVLLSEQPKELEIEQIQPMEWRIYSGHSWHSVVYSIDDPEAGQDTVYLDNKAVGTIDVSSVKGQITSFILVLDGRNVTFNLCFSEQLIFY